MIIADMKAVTGIYNGKTPIKEVRYGNYLVWKKGSGHISKYDREVEYLIAKDSDTYIITGLKLQDLTRYDIEIKGWCGLGATMLFGVRDAATSSGNLNQFALLHSQNGQYQLRVQTGSVSGSFTANDTLPHVFRWSGKDRMMYIDGVKFNGSVSLAQAQSVNSNLGLALFGCNSGFVDNMGKDRAIYYVKVFEDGEPIMDYVSVIDNNGIACFYDKVNERLIRCSSTGTFGFVEKEKQE